MNKNVLITIIYNALLSLMVNGSIPVQLLPSVTGTVQDDSFDRWIMSELERIVPKGIEIFHAGNLTTPDLIIRDRATKTTIGIEVKKLIQKTTGADPRGMTMDYNSCLPCGSTLIKVGENTEIIPCYYLNALLSPDCGKIVSLIILDGDFLNFDFNEHKKSKLSNFSEYKHGPYGEGSVRIRKMYTYPNPLNSKIEAFFRHYVLVIKKQDFYPGMGNVTKQMIRTDVYGNNYIYYMIDNCSEEDGLGEVLRDIFESCKKRKRKMHIPAIVKIPSLEA